MVTSPRETLKSIPKENFLFGPSPVQYLGNLSKTLSDNAVEIFSKREDCNSGLAYGGNKVRKLEYLVADAKKEGADTLVSIGGVQSNHTRAVTAVAVASGLKVSTVQEHWVEWEDAHYEKVGNIQLSRLMGGDVRLDPSEFDIGHRTSLKKLKDELEGKGRKPYYIPAGASDHPLGGLGFVNFMLELAEQEVQIGKFFDTIVVCSVTGSSHAGIAVGAALLEKEGGKKRKVIGIDASGKPAQTKAQVEKIAQATASLIGLEGEIPIILDERYNAKVYGIPDETTIEAMKLAASTEALITDPVYEGKSMAGLIDLVKKGEIGAGSKVLYVHLGGQPALSSYSSIP